MNDNQRFEDTPEYKTAMTNYRADVLRVIDTIVEQMKLTQDEFAIWDLQRELQDRLRDMGSKFFVEDLPRKRIQYSRRHEKDGA